MKNAAYEETQLWREVALAAEEEAQAEAQARKDLRALVRGLKATDRRDRSRFARREGMAKAA